MQVSQTAIAELLPHGGQSQIARKLGISRQAVALALSKGKPGHPAVIEALRMAQESGALATAQGLATLSS